MLRFRLLLLPLLLPQRLQDKVRDLRPTVLNSIVGGMFIIVDKH